MREQEQKARAREILGNHGEFLEGLVNAEVAKIRATTIDEDSEFAELKRLHNREGRVDGLRFLIQKLNILAK